MRNGLVWKEILGNMWLNVTSEFEKKDVQNRLYVHVHKILFCMPFSKPFMLTP